VVPTLSFEHSALARPMPREAPVTRAVFPESLLMTWVPDDWTLTPGAVFAVAESAKFPFRNDGGERQPLGGLQIRILALQC
jgi:hypothetical protein